MVDPSVCPPKADVELADVVRQFGPQYTSQYGQGMMPSQKKALSDIAACCTKELGGRSFAVTIAMTRFCTTTAVVIGRAQMPWKPDPTVAPRASSRVVALRLFSRSRDRAFGVAHSVPSQSEVAVRSAHASLGHGGQGPLCPETAPRGTARHAVRCSTPGTASWAITPCPPADHRWWDHCRWSALGASSGRVPRAGLRPFPQESPRNFCAALKAAAPAVFADIPACVWKREWVSFCKHYGHGNDAVVGLSVAVCLSDGDQQRTDSRHGPIPCDFPLERSRRRRVAHRAAARR